MQQIKFLTFRYQNQFIRCVSSFKMKICFIKNYGDFTEKEILSNPKHKIRKLFIFSCFRRLKTRRTIVILVMSF